MTLRRSTDNGSSAITNLKTRYSNNSRRSNPLRARTFVIAFLLVAFATSAWAQSDPKYKANEPDSVTRPDTVETRFGTLKFFDFLPDAETVKKRAADPLPSWNEGKTKQAIVTFVAKVTTKGSPDFVPPEERIATFDNDGTLWAEQPLYFQIIFAFDRIKELAPQHPEWKEHDPYKSVLAGDMKGAFAGGSKSLVEIMTAGAANMTTEEYDRVVKTWIATAKHPKTGRVYSEMVYQPMLELLAYLRANGFKTFIVSGGGIDFMRAFAEKVYGVPPEQVVGSEGKLEFQMRDGQPVLMKMPALDFFDDNVFKPVAIQSHIGRRPIAAFGNSDGDLQMLQYTCGGPGARFCLFVRHTDGEREWAYDVTPLGRLEKGLAEAAAKGWTIADMKKDWKVIYPFQSK